MRGVASICTCSTVVPGSRVHRNRSWFPLLLRLPNGRSLPGRLNPFDLEPGKIGTGFLNQAGTKPVFGFISLAKILETIDSTMFIASGIAARTGALRPISPSSEPSSTGSQPTT